MKNKLSFLVVVVCVLVLSSAHNSIAGGPDSQVTQRKIAVVGSAEMEVVPDEIYVTFTLKEYLSKEKKKVALESLKTDFLRLCKAAGIADSNISIAGYTGNERWEYFWRKKRKEEPDFMSSISYAIMVNSVEKIDKIVAGFNEQAVDNFYISKTSHSRIEQLRKEVKIKALAASKAKAEYLAQSIGEKVGAAILIQEVADSYNFGYGMQNLYSNTVSQATMDSEGGSSSAPDFQKIKLRYEMRVEFELQ